VACWFLMDIRQEPEQQVGNGRGLSHLGRVGNGRGLSYLAFAESDCLAWVRLTATWYASSYGVIALAAVQRKPISAKKELWN
jgi:hypothetical protein